REARIDHKRSPWYGDMAETGERECAHNGHSQGNPQYNSKDESDESDQNRFPSDHGPRLAARQTQGPKKADFTGPFNDRERQRVDDSEGRDEDRQRQEDID